MAACASALAVTMVLLAFPALAVGTAFNIRAGNRVTVPVRKCVVRVSDLALAPTYLSAVVRIDPNESGRWREGWLTYRNQPLKAVVADLCRYTDLKVDVDASAGDLRLVWCPKTGFRSGSLPCPKSFPSPSKRTAIA